MKRVPPNKLSSITPGQIRGARVLLGWSQEHLAHRSGISPRSVAAVELETTIPKSHTLESLIRALEVNGVEFSWTREGWPAIALDRARAVQAAEETS